MDNLKWNKRFLKLASEIASWSKDPSTKVGAVIIGPDREPRGFGFNGFPRRVDDNETDRFERPIKYKFSEHAERNAIYQMTLVGIPAKDCVMYATHFPCADCARAIIQTGISGVVVDGVSITDEYKSRWEDDMKISVAMFDEAGIRLLVI